ncbi:MAG: TolC family protein [Tannerella sp.]|nr:TolC family protein [Tannerella sp.]
MKRLPLILMFLLTALIAQSQENVRQWTLQDCLNYALEHNIQVKKSKVSQQSGAEDLAQAKAQLFPSLSAGISQSVVNYPSDAATLSNSYAGSYSLSASWMLYDGGRRSTSVKQNELLQDMNQLAVAQSESDIRVALVQAFMQALYAMESVRTNENTVEVTKTQYERSSELLKAGSISRVDLAQIESQYSSDKYRLVVSQTSLDNYLLQLKQLLELDITEKIEIAAPELTTEQIMTPLTDKQTIYQTALAVRPEMKISQLNMDLVELDIKKAKAGYYPTLSLNADIGTGNASGTSLSFGTQAWDRLNESLRLSLSIPIYSNRNNKTAVNKARLASVTGELDLLNTQKQLLQTVENFYLEATSSQNQYMAAAEQVRYVQDSYQLIEEQFFLGMKNTLELLTAKNNLLNAQQELLQSKYMAVMNIQLLNIYQDLTVEI